ncbi:williams-Beuren syndrome critical region protein 22 [Ephemerocybe angulata]|uniref:Williams-Beuren syndrome critical region protein 22 n=1 Tax=Ephemerocybe angulata TaxID=980116 RepID=A0A8H6MFX3_9AGAR|nr:williams-Beuren syndrome critical region protein 22 [Tulosesus angulatus]
MSRPELQAPPEIWYGDIEAKKYTANTRNQQIQADMTYRALELLNLPPDEPAFLLDIGCGSGLSGEILDAEGMLEVALEREVEGDLFLQDIGTGLWFPPSISVLQWLLNAETSHPTSSPPHRLTRFFTTLHSALKNPSRAVFQFYPTSDDQIQLITSIAQKAGFGGGIVVDYPNSKKARKVFLCLYVGQQKSQQVPQGLDGDEEQDAKVRFERRRQSEKVRSKSKRKAVKGRDWILKKKELYRKRGKEQVPRDSKYTGRKRKATF